jgi:hypothetical protein
VISWPTSWRVDVNFVCEKNKCLEMYICHADTTTSNSPTRQKSTKKPSVPYVWSVLLDRHVAVTKMGTQILFVSPQIANPQIIGLIPQSHIRKFEVCQSTKRKSAKL